MPLPGSYHQPIRRRVDRIIKRSGRSFSLMTKICFFISLLMLSVASFAQTVFTDSKTIQKQEGDTILCFGKLYFDYELPHRPAVLLLNDDSKIFIGKNDRLAAEGIAGQFMILKGVFRHNSNGFNYQDYLSQPGAYNQWKGRCAQPDSLIRTLIRAESIDTFYAVPRITCAADGHGAQPGPVLCIGKITGANSFSLAGDGTGISLRDPLICELGNATQEGLIGVLGYVGTEGENWTLGKGHCAWAFPVCRTAADFSRYSGKEVVLEGTATVYVLKKPVKTKLPALLLSDKSLVYIDSGQELLRKERGKKKKMLATVSLASSEPFFVAGGSWSPGLLYVASLNNLIH